MTTKIIVAGILYLLTLITGVLLSKAGRPYKTGIVTIHKLLSLAALVLVGFAIYGHNKAVGLNTTHIALIIATGILYLLALATGGKLSHDKESKFTITVLHKIVPFLILIVGAVMIYQLY